MSLIVTISATTLGEKGELKVIDYITIQNRSIKDKSELDEGATYTYRVTVNNGEELFMIKHKWEEGARVLVKKVLNKLCKERSIKIGRKIGGKKW